LDTLGLGEKDAETQEQQAEVDDFGDLKPEWGTIYPRCQWQVCAHVCMYVGVSKVEARAAIRSATHTPRVPARTRTRKKLTPCTPSSPLPQVKYAFKYTPQGLIDPNAVYFAQLLPGPGANMTFRIRGRYPAVRYFSFQVRRGTHTHTHTTLAHGDTGSLGCLEASISLSLGSC
jgi:hypothetical protein